MHMRFKKFKNLLADDTGATAIEYGLIAGLIFVVIIVSVQGMMSGQDANYQIITNAVDGAINP